MKTRTVINTGIYILISALLLLSLFPVKIFTYPSMFIHFVFCTFSCTGGVIIAIAAFLKKEIIPVNRFFFLPIAWLVFITLHAFVIPGELYKTEYLSCTLLYPIIMGVLIKHRIIQKEFVISAFGIIGIIEGVACTLQYFGVIHPTGAFFSITGTFSNPNISALMIVASLPTFLT